MRNGRLNWRDQSKTQCTTSLRATRDHKNHHIYPLVHHNGAIVPSDSRFILSLAQIIVNTRLSSPPSTPYALVSLDLRLLSLSAVIHHLCTIPVSR
ncbi:hypothetical protein B0H12DRAFT_1138746 [Mycena haematopus]|nr:hypothetical protein B0H12DRAFT_1138746 [Mycena haematopus]